MRLLITVISLVACVIVGVGGAAYGGSTRNGLSVTSVKGESGTSYHLYERGADLDVVWQTKRPSKSDPRIRLCIPAAFTTTTGTVVGIYCVNGKIGHRKQISKPIGGVLEIVNGKFKIFPSNKGAKFTPEFLASLETNKASLFQQFQLVENGTPAKFKDKKHFQMRAIAKFSSGLEAIVESDTAIDFKTFNSDLVVMGVKDAIYTDMGAWDEGWYRDPKAGNLVAIGLDRSKTDKQTNWVTFVQRP
ncbi:hypothetical protein KF728_08695 [Candidatus Obscuribacterales bacterium]|nr:hypothetical protein [Candidatus Obscuribacterales bacterium]